VLIGLNCLHYLEHGLYYLFITFVVAWYNHLLCYLHYLQHSVFTFLTVSEHLQHCHECHLHVYLNYLLLPIGLCQQHHHQSAASESSEDALNNEGDALGGHLPQLLAAAAAVSASQSIRPTNRPSARPPPNQPGWESILFCMEPESQKGPIKALGKCYH